MTSLRSRRSMPLEQQHAEEEEEDSSSSLEIRRRKRRKSKRRAPTQDGFAKFLLGVGFVLLCGGLSVREYTKHNKSKLASRQHDVQHDEITSSEDAALELHDADNTRYQVIFSTDCSPYQHWQSYLVYYSAYKVRQPGHVTRIASGCTEEETLAIQEWFDTHVQPLSSRFHLHLTPKFSNVKTDGQDTGQDYKFFNKPLGLKHWMEHSANFSLDQQEDDVVILIDPDMVLLRPITGDFSNDRETIIAGKRKKHLLATHVQHGIPFAQTYGLGTQWQKFNLDKIAGENSPAKLVDQEEGFLYYPAGPPYIATAKDMYAISQKWTEFVPHVYEEYPHLLAEMFAYCIAAAHLGLKHQLVNSLMVSNTDISVGEGWELVDNMPAGNMCEIAAHPQHEVYAVPSVVHLCQRYSVGDEWFFGKHRVPNNVYDCEYPLFVEPPSNVALLFDYKKPPNAKERKSLSQKMIAREAFMVCFLTSLLNEAAAFYKQRACPAGTANLSKTLKMTDLFSERERKP